MKLKSHEVTLIFPDQLFKQHPALSKNRPVFLVEEYLYFRIQPFHKQRLVLLRAAMKEYATHLINHGHDVYYLDSKDLQTRGDLLDYLKNLGVRKIHLAEITDEWLSKDFEKGTVDGLLSLITYPTPMFLCSADELYNFFEGKKKFSMAQFYSYQRKKLDILMDQDGPIGGKYSFDTENRSKLPKGLCIPEPYIPQKNQVVSDAAAYVEKEFPYAIGVADVFTTPTNFKEAKLVLQDFIKHRLSLFGDYEDAIQTSDSTLFHSVLSPLLNIGLLTPREVIDAVLQSFYKLNFPINSIEGFIRQIIGWREFIRACYLIKGTKQRTTNTFGHTNPIPKSFWEAKTGLEPIDHTIKKVLKTGYCHHIERLMILGNFLLLTETDPNLVYEWFMANFIDAYDWVMVSNVYGMSQYADGGEMTTKPYVSGSNYILKMSNYKKGDWVDIWDGLFWRFLSKHRTLFSVNPRTAVLIKHFQNNQDKINVKIQLCENWLKNYYHRM